MIDTLDNTLSVGIATHLPQKPFRFNPRLSDLSLTTIDDLCIGSVHDGRYVKLKIAKKCHQIRAVQIVCEDHKGTKVDVSIYNFDTKGKTIFEVFYIGRTMYIKEPFFKIALAGNRNIRVDNPLDVLFEDDPQIIQLTNPLNINQLEEKYRKQGIHLMKSEQYVSAYILYTEALNRAKSEENIIKFLLNKAIVCYKINILKQYRDLVNKVIQKDHQNTKAHYHKIKAFALLSTENSQIMFQKSQQMIKQHSHLFDESTKKELLKFLISLKDNRDGKIDWYQAFKHGEVEQFQSKDIVIKKCSYGLGLFAKQTIKPGTLLLIDRAFMMIQQKQTNNNKMIFNEKQIKMEQQLQKMRKASIYFNEKIQHIQFMILNKIQDESLLEQSESKIILKKGYVNFGKYWFGVDSLKEVIHSIKIVSGRQQKLGLFFKGGLINHACQSNCDRLFIKDKMVVFATKQIPANLQVLIAYRGESDFQERHQVLQSWNIECNCIFCKQQQYEILMNKPHPNPQSMELKKYRLIKENIFSNQWLSFYDMQTISYLARSGALNMAYTMFKRNFPMTQQQALQLLLSGKPKQK